MEGIIQDLIEVHYLLLNDICEAVSKFVQKNLSSDNYMKVVQYSGSADKQYLQKGCLLCTKIMLKRKYNLLNEKK